MLKNFKTYGVTVKKVEDIQMSNKISWGTKKNSYSDVTLGWNNFHQKVKNPFGSTLVLKLKGAIDKSYQLIVSALRTLDPVSFLATTREKYGGEEMETLQNYYGNPKIGELQTLLISADKIFNVVMKGYWLNTQQGSFSFAKKLYKQSYNRFSIWSFNH